MKLMMYIGNDLIEAIPINAKDLKVPGYLGKFKRHLKLKYSNLLKSAGETVEFLVFNMDKSDPLPASNQAGQQH
jgi:hypothetical protein